MSLRTDVLDCLRQRLLNQDDAGPVFESDQEHLNWLVGSPDADAPGFLADPSHALSRSVVRNAQAPTHPGVELSPEEADQLRTAVSRVARGGLVSSAASRSTGLLVAAVTFLGPLLADSNGY